MWSFQRFSRINFAILGMVVVFLTGVFGYMEIENFTFLDSFYMTIITISTVGFSEIRPLSDGGRLFTAFLIIMSFGIFAFAVQAISTYIYTGELRRYFRERRVIKTIGQLKGHIIICGYGRNGKRAAEEFKAHKETFVIIEMNEEVIQDAQDRDGILIIKGDSTLDEILDKAHVKTAKALISTLPEDANNLLTVLTARELNRVLLIISRASHDRSYQKLIIAGANNVIMPDKIGGAHMASLVLKPDVIEFFDQIIMKNPDSPYLKEVLCSDLSGDENEYTLRELKSFKKYGVTIIGTKKSDGEYVVNPSDDLTLSPGTKLFVLGTPEQISSLST